MERGKVRGPIEKRYSSIKIDFLALKKNMLLATKILPVKHFDETLFNIHQVIIKLDWNFNICDTVWYLIYYTVIWAFAI